MSTYLSPPWKKTLNVCIFFFCACISVQIVLFSLFVVCSDATIHTPNKQKNNNGNRLLEQINKKSNVLPQYITNKQTKKKNG